jgi:hypothetical protein
MAELLLTPLIAFVVYALAASAISGLGRLFSAKGSESQFKSEAYASGEDHDPLPAAPGYRQFFVIALFFAVLHLGVIMVGSSDLFECDHRVFTRFDSGADRVDFRMTVGRVCNPPFTAKVVIL